MRIHNIKYPIIILYCIFLHILWGVLLVVDYTSGNITTLYDLTHLFGHALPYILIGVASLAAYPLFFSMGLVWSIIMIIPQQLILMISAMTAINAMICGCFADGVIRSHLFLVSDQGTFVLAAIFHTLALIGSYVRLPLIDK